MNEELITITTENVDTESLCCIVRKKAHPGIDAKRAWLRDRLTEGHVFRKIRGDGCAFIEYAPLKHAWTPIVGKNYFYIYCLWVDGVMKKHGYGKLLMESCLRDAQDNGYSGSFDGTTPRFSDSVKKMTIPEKELTIYYDCQCPFIPARIDMLRQHCLDKKIPAQFIAVDSLDMAKSLPCVFNNWAVFFGGQFVTVNQIDRGFVERLVSGTE